MMNCFLWSPRRRRDRDAEHSPCSSPSSYAAQSSLSIRRPHLHADDDSSNSNSNPTSRVVGGTTHKFTLAQLSAATDGFRGSNLVGKGGFDRVYKGRLCLSDDGNSICMTVAVKQLCRDGAQGSREFLVECMMLMMLHRPNLVSLVDYCADAQERLLVYEFLPRGSLDAHLFPPTAGEQLDWNARVKIAVGAARGLRYLHEVVTPPVIYRDLKSSNILLGEDLSPKLSDLGLAKLGPMGDDTHVSTRVMGTYGYCAPDYAVTGKLNVKSDVYSFGAVLLELITGRRAFDADREEPRLLVWARPYLLQVQGHGRSSSSSSYLLGELADPALHWRFPRRALYQGAVIASLCLHEKPNLRPTMSDITQALEHVASQPWVGEDDGSGRHQDQGRPGRRRRRGGSAGTSTMPASSDCSVEQQ